MSLTSKVLRRLWKRRQIWLTIYQSKQMWLEKKYYNDKDIQIWGSKNVLKPNEKKVFYQKTKV